MTIAEYEIDGFPNEMLGYWQEMEVYNCKLVACENGPAVKAYANVLTWTESAVEEMGNLGIDPGLQVRVKKISEYRINGRLLSVRLEFNHDLNVSSGYLTSLIRIKNDGLLEENRIWKRDGMLYSYVKYYKVIKSA